MLACGSAAFEQCRLSVDRFVACIGERTFEEIYAWSIETGWGEDWQQAGVIASAIYNAQRSSRDDHFFKPDEFIPTPQFTKTHEQREAQAKQLAAIEQVVKSRYGKHESKPPAVFVPAQTLGPPKGWRGPPPGLSGAPERPVM